MLTGIKRAAAALLLLALGATNATNIDTDGFSLDGATTYCMGIGSGGSAGSLTFDTLLVSNGGRCPVDVSLSLTSTQFHVATTFTVSWSASVDSSVTDGIFPNAIDSNTGLPGAVVTSLMWACTSGTNCGTNVAGAPAGTGGSSSGAFDSDKTKQLEDNSFTLTTEGTYIIVGLVQLPGDSSLDVSAEEYLVFETITIVSADTEITPTPTTATPSSSSASATGSGSTASTMTPTPTAAGSSSSSGNLTSTAVSSSSGSASTPGTVKPNSSGSSSSKTTTDSTSSPDSATSSSAATGNADAASASSSTVMLIALLAGGCVICVVGFVMFMRHRKGKHIQANKAYDFNSPGGDAIMSGAGAGAMGKRTKSKVDLGYVANISARNTDRSNDDAILMSDDTCVIMASAERGSELNASSVGSSVRHSSIDHGSVHQFDSSRDVLASASAGVTGGAFAAAAAAPALPSPRDPSNVSELSSLASEIHDHNFSVDDTQSVSNYGDSVVDESQHNYLQSFDWKQSQYGSEMGDDDKGRGYSTASGYSEFSARDTSLSEDRHSTVGGAAGATSEYRPTDMSDATRASRLDSEISVDSYTFRPSRESTDSYGSGFSMYSRNSSRISGMSNFSDAESTK